MPTFSLYCNQKLDHLLANPLRSPSLWDIRFEESFSTKTALPGRKTKQLLGLRFFTMKRNLAFEFQVLIKKRRTQRPPYDHQI